MTAQSLSCGRDLFSMRAAATFSSNRDHRDQLAFIVGDGFTPFGF
jgi:hypothetical protein